MGNLIAVYLNQELNSINQAEIESKADYNYCLTHVRTHAESIAFFSGEKQELNIIERRYSKLLTNIKRKIDWERNRDIFNRAYQVAIELFMLFILAPLYIKGEIDFGQVGQASVASFMFATALGELITAFGSQ